LHQISQVGQVRCMHFKENIHSCISVRLVRLKVRNEYLRKSGKRQNGRRKCTSFDAAPPGNGATASERQTGGRMDPLPLYRTKDYSLCVGFRRGIRRLDLDTRTANKTRRLTDVGRDICERRDEEPLISGAFCGTNVEATPATEKNLIPFKFNGSRDVRWCGDYKIKLIPF
jgi:hypothetical protein